MFLAKTLSFYKREDVQQRIVDHAAGKELAVKYGDRGFGRRPQVVSYPNDILELAKNRATSFHGSEELWDTVSLLQPSMKRAERDANRKGWDFILDLDCQIFEYSRIAAHYVVKAIAYCGVPDDAISVKFSGNKGFHIAVPWEAFPNEFYEKDVTNLFPEAPRRMAEYVKFLIQEPVKQKIIEKEGNDINAISEKVGIPVEKLRVETADGIDLNPDPFIEMDTLLISSRHLYRMPYSFHEKSELVSLPIGNDAILGFEKPMAEPDRIDELPVFCSRDVEPGCARSLLIRAYDFKPEVEHDEPEETEQHWELPEEAIGEDCFPPCIQRIMEGLGDGRKRAVFILINFLRTCGWGVEQIEDTLHEWNERNPEPLREVYIKSQLRYAKNKDPVPPPNCHHQGYYVDMGVKCDEKICGRYKNPVNFAKACSERDDGDDDS